MTLGVIVLILFSSLYFLGGRDAYFERQRETYISHEAGLLIHIAAMMLAIAMGPSQFLRGFRERHRGVHRAMGKVYLGAGTIGAFGGIYMSFHSYGGAITGVSFFLLGAGVLLANYMAFAAIRRRDIATHREWMMRSFALMLAAVTLRLYAMPLEAVFGQDTGYYITAWACWVPNLLLAEGMIRRGRSRVMTVALHSTPPAGLHLEKPEPASLVRPGP